MFLHVAHPCPKNLEERKVKASEPKGTFKTLIPSLRVQNPFLDGKKLHICEVDHWIVSPYKIRPMM
jgi:hypothetical protein